MDALDIKTAKARAAQDEAFDKIGAMLRRHGASLSEIMEADALILRAVFAAEDRSSEVVHRAYGRVLSGRVDQVDAAEAA